jgi:hypothetical protein
MMPAAIKATEKAILYRISLLGLMFLFMVTGATSITQP